MGATAAWVAPEPLITDAPNNLNAIRIAMALAVVWSHSFALYLGSEATEPLSRLTNGVMNAGEMAVDVFFMVSGLLIAQSFDRSSSPWSYLRKRVARIYPGYLVASALCAFVVLPLCISQIYTPRLALKTIGLNLLLQGWFPTIDVFPRNPGHGVNGSLWSIPFEFWCYLGICFIGVIGLLRRRALVAAFFFALMLIKIWLDMTGRRPGSDVIGLIIGWPYLWFRMLPCFLAGTLAYLYRVELPRSKWLLLGGLVLFVAGTHLPWLRITMTDLVLPPVIAYATFYVAYAPQLFDAAMFGDFSYGAYLYAFPIQQMLKAYGNLSFGAYIMWSILLTLLAGAASWYAIERWFLSSKKRTTPTIVLSVAGNTPIDGYSGSSARTH